MLGNGDDGPTIAGFNLNPANLALPVVNILHNTPGKDDFYTLELSANRRNDRQVVARRFVCVPLEPRQRQRRTSARTCARARQDVANPNDMINTDDGRYVFGTWSAKAHGTYQAPWDLLVTPALRMQAGQPYGADDSRSTHQLRRAADPGRADRLAQQDNIILLDTRVEKVFKVGGGRSVSVFVDGYNLTNANPASNINWGSGLDVPAAGDDRLAAARTIRREVRLVRGQLLAAGCWS